MLLALITSSLAACSGGGGIPEINRTYEKIASDTLYTRKVEGLSDDFIIGMDASSVPSLEDSGVNFYDFDGTKKDVFEILSKYGVNYIRVRVWNNPYDDNGHGFGGGNNDIDRAVEIGKRATQYNMKLLVDFHYSDFWADPAKQKSPRAWADMNINEKGEALYQFTRDSLIKLRNAHVNVGMVQVGNETNGGKMAGETRFSFYSYLFNQGSKAVREIYPEALVACHFANPEKTDNYRNTARDLAKNNVDYDVFGTSYYPYWHGTLDNLQTILSEIGETYNKKTMVMETSYAFTEEDFDFGGNTIGSGGGIDKPYPFTIAGQANCFRDVVDTVAHSTNGIGVCYWEGTWISAGGASYEENSAKWEQYGSGWAASYARIFDKDVEEWGPGGSMVDNQTFFGTNGKPLESIKVLNNVRFGNDAPVYVDGVQDVSVSHYTYEDFSLPETVDVIYSDNSRSPLPVVWEEFDIPAAKAAGNGKYTIKGHAEGYDGDVYCYLTIMELNFMKNHSFEEITNHEADNWTVTNNSSLEMNNNPDDSSSTYKALPTAENPQTGKYAFHFWAKDANIVNFDVEQEVELETSGNYKLQASILGGNDGEITPDLQNIYMYVKIDGTIQYQLDMRYSGYNNKQFTDFLLKGIEYEVGQKLVVGFHVETFAANSWGDIDDVMLNIVL